jgi:hypothetical protein
MNIGTIAGGQAANATAAECQAKLLIRVVSDPIELQERIQKVNKTKTKNITKQM